MSQRQSPGMSVPEPGRLSAVSGVGIAGLLAITAATAATPAPGTKKPIAETAQEILTRRCLNCHGTGKLGDLDLRTRESTLRGGTRGPALVPGKPDQSLLVRAVRWTEGAPKMPPAGKLPDREIALLEQWIREGASSGVQASGRPGVPGGPPGVGPGGSTPAVTHWAFAPLSKPRVPKVKDGAWVRNPVDAFVLAKLEAKGLHPAPPADPRTLIRRVTFDLTGLPPTPEDVEAFVQECAAWQGSGFGVQGSAKGIQVSRYSGIGSGAPGSQVPASAPPRHPNTQGPRSGHPPEYPNTQSPYEKLVDRLLASPRYGERWARHWLDVARFGESQGFERDKIREHAWRYRDYVIRSFNEDKPYDRFVREQLAGDVLPDANAETITATGFLVAGPWDEVGNLQASAVMRARVREDELEDIVSVVGQTFLGATVNCARCHDHKFDPIPQKDYYRLAGVLAGVKHGDRPLLTSAQVAERDAETVRLRQQAGQLNAVLRELDAEGNRRAAARRQAAGQAVPEPPVRPVLRWSFEGDARDRSTGLDLTLSSGATLSGGRLKLDGKTGQARSGPLPLALGAKTLEAWVTLAGLDQQGGSALTVETADGGAFDAIVFGELQPKRWLAGSEGYRRSRELQAPDETSPPGTLVHVAIAYGPDGAITLYRNGQQYGGSYHPGGGGPRSFPAGGSHVLFGLRHTGTNARLAGEIEEARVYSRRLTPEEVLASFNAGPSAISAEEARAALTEEEQSRRAEAVAELERTRTRLEALKVIPLAYAATAQAPPTVHLLHRGDVLQKREPIAPAGLSFLPGLPGDLGLDPAAPDAVRRLALADWIVHRDNPLTPRVMANRVWQYLFGRGLAGSPSDFGMNGEAPSHRELLDYLASTFVSGDAESGGVGARESGKGKGQANPHSPTPPLPHSPPWSNPWSVKSLIRLIVRSSAYMQGGRFDARAAAVDGENRLLWRRAPRRMDAEELRDAQLAVSGQLNLGEPGKEGGPGFRAFDLFIQNSHFYTYEDKLGPEYNRRGIYRTVVISGGIPLLEAFDCPDPSVKTPRRSSTTTPLQALALLNNSFVLRQARELASRVEREGGATPERRVERAYRLTFGRPPSLAEVKRGAGFVREHGLEAFSRVLLNASEFVYVR